MSSMAVIVMIVLLGFSRPTKSLVGPQSTEVCWFVMSAAVFIEVWADTVLKSATWHTHHGLPRSYRWLNLTRKYCIFLCKAGQFCCVVPSEMSCDNSLIPCILQVTEMYWFGQHKESDVEYYEPVSIIWCKYFSFYLPVDGSDIIQQWSKFNMGALSSGPIFCDEWKAQSQPSGQTAVSRYVFENEEGLFLSTSC